MNKITVINHLDPRAGLWLLLMANIGMFCQKNSEQGSMLSGIFLLLMLVHGLYKAAGKGIVLLVSFHLLLMYVFPQCPAWMNMVFPVLVNYSLRMLPCFLAGLLLLRTSSMQKMIAAMYTLHSEPCSPGSGRHQNSGHSGSQSAQPVLWDAPESCDCIGRGD